MGGAGYAGTVGDWRAVCAAASGDARSFFEENFTPYAGGAARRCSPAITSRRSAAAARGSGAFQTPVYGLPPDLVRADLGLFDPKLQGEHISGRLDGPCAGALCRPRRDRRPGVANAHGPVLDRRSGGACSFCRSRARAGCVFDDGSTRAHRLCRREWPALHRHRPHPDRRGALTRENVSLQAIRAWLHGPSRPRRRR